jgi:hypothetical protein
MVDLFCLGVKESLWKFNEYPHDFKRVIDDLKSASVDVYDIVSTTYPLVHNIIYGAIEFAGEYGFHPHKSFEVSRFLLEEDDEHIPIIDIEFGHEGKPLYISNPDRPVERNKVLAHLEKVAGKGNYNYITEAEADDYLNDEDEEEEEEADETEEVDYTDPEVKAKLIRELLELSALSDDQFVENPVKLVELLYKAEIVFINYMVSGVEVKNVFEYLVPLLEFSVSEQSLSDEMIFGNSPVSDNHDQIRKEAHRLLNMGKEKRPAAIKASAEKLISKYPGVPVFHYFFIKYSMLKKDLKKIAPTLREHAVSFPDYLPIIYLVLEIDYVAKKSEEIPEFPEHLHLKNFYRGKKEFCVEEISLYFRTLILAYGMTSDILKLLITLSIKETHFSDLGNVGEIITGKLMILPDILAWCTEAIKE